MLSCTGPLALPGGRSVLQASHIYQRSGVALVARASRKQSQKQSPDVGADLASDVLPADLDKLSKLAKAELQHQLEVRGLDKDGNKEELASRLLDNLIAQESVLSTNPPDRVKLQQQLEQGSIAGRRGRHTSRKATASADPQPESSSVGSPQAADSVIAAAMTVEPPVEAPAAAAAAGSRRGRKTSRKATSSVDPLPSAAEIAAGAAAEHVRRGRKTSRKATTSADPLPAAPADVLAASPSSSAAAEGASADGKPARRGRKTSRKATTSAEPLDPVAAAAEAAAAADSATESPISKQRGRRRSKTTAADPSPSAAAAPTEEAAPAKAAGRGRRASRRSSVLEPESTDAAPSAAASAEAPARQQRGRRTSSAKTATSAGAAADEAAAPAPSTAAAEAPVSRAKLLAQQLAKKEIATHGQGAAGAGAAASGAAAAPGSAWVGADELLYAGSQAQSDNLLMGGDNSMQAVGAESSFTIDNGSVDEVMAQISAERAAGLADEPQLRPEAATLSSNFEGMMNPPSAGAADAAASWGAAAAATGAAADAAVGADGQHPSLTDCVAAVEEPLTAAAEAVEVDEAPDAAMAAFDHMYVHIASPGAAEADLQHPNLSDCVAAVEEPLPAQADPAPLLVVDEAPDAAMAAFDHTSLDTPAAAAVAGGNQTPNLQDIVLAVESSPLPPSLDESLGEDEEPDVALAAFDHIDMPALAAAAPAAATAAVVTDDGAAAAAAAAGGYDQAYLDPMQPSATVGSGSVDIADAEVVVTAAAPVTAAAAVPAKQQQAQQQQQQKAGAAGQGAPDLSVMVQRWWSSVVAMFEDWQKNLSGPK